MRQLRLWIDDEQIGAGQRVFLVVSEGTRNAHLLHVPTLTHVAVPLDEVRRQLRSKLGAEVPITRGVIGRITEKRREMDRRGTRYSGAWVKQALAALREERV